MSLLYSGIEGRIQYNIISVTIIIIEISMQPRNRAALTNGDEKGVEVCCRRHYGIGTTEECTFSLYLGCSVSRFQRPSRDCHSSAGKSRSSAHP